ncbi:hypothetical protein CANARDRAFT_6109 [[Candida] arabinofermentans NRRL YB-2248]|uniref:Scaffold protein Nfu/NifU N-terminal domain-containing protein n=1 Tax=[Candida] arabinofermentans NRRL YB-2248 TaxID=983967 RepID=A0A1E4T768_9ASCO|nr:hypothetical protein CANARDRAFT_6109 [[Candida] arabinofermentans NRRL YB-2248]
MLNHEMKNYIRRASLRPQRLADTFHRSTNFSVYQSFQKRNLFIQTLTTPNEHALKFVPSDTKILPTSTSPTLEINGIKDALHKSELAFKLLSINDKSIESILFGYDFITIVKRAEWQWAVLKPEVFSILTEHLSAGTPIINKKYAAQLKQQQEQQDSDDLQQGLAGEGLEDEDEVVSLINELLVTRIQPAIQEDGGDIKFVSFDEVSGTVYLKLIGACKTCSSSEITLKNGIEEMLKYYIDEVKSVMQIQDGESNVGEDDVVTAASDNSVSRNVDQLPPSL